LAIAWFNLHTTINTDGGYWSVLRGGSKLRGFHSHGTIDREIDLPVSQPTMPAFAGELLPDSIQETTASTAIFGAPV
jgi:sugar lactone lactonase YvrE